MLSFRELQDAFADWRDAFHSWVKSVGTDGYQIATNRLFWSGRAALEHMVWRGEQGAALRHFRKQIDDWDSERVRAAMDAGVDLGDIISSREQPSEIPLRIVEAGHAVEHEMARIESVASGRSLAGADGLLGRLIVTVYAAGGRMLRARLHQLHRPDETADRQLSQLLTPGGRWVTRGIGTIEGETVILGIRGVVEAERLFQLGTKPLGDD